MYVDIHSKAGNAVAESFREQLTRQCKKLRIDLEFGAPPAGTPGGITVVFARKGSKWTDAEEKVFAQRLKEGRSVLPVVPDPPAAQFLPKSLAPINAFITGFFGKVWPECLTDETLSMMWLHRRTPKVFISYKRTDSAPIAAQLYDRLNHLGYETFFDEASVQRGADFQRELKWWLNDADLLIVLASPRFPQSKWCMEEVTFCQQRFIGVATVEWPDAIYKGRLQFADLGRNVQRPIIVKRATADQAMRLKPGDFVKKRVRGRVVPLHERELTKEALGRVLALCARQRTIGIQQRLDDLIPLAQRLLPGATPVVGTMSPGDLAWRDTGGIDSFVRVLPFRPRPESIQQACRDGVGPGRTIAGCFYAENDPYDPRAQALRWLANATRPKDASILDARIWASCGGWLLDKLP
jgi:hypothetical protein